MRRTRKPHRTQSYGWHEIFRVLRTRLVDCYYCYSFLFLSLALTHSLKAFHVDVCIYIELRHETKTKTTTTTTTNDNNNHNSGIDDDDDDDWEQEIPKYTSFSPVSVSFSSDQSVHYISSQIRSERKKRTKLSWSILIRQIQFHFSSFCS